MSASIPNRAKALRERLEALESLGANMEEASNLEGLRSDLVSPASDLSRALDQRALLVDSGIDVEAPPSLTAVRKRASEILEKFKVEQTAAILKKGTRWPKLISELKIASNDVADTVAKTWKAYRQEIFTGENPAIVKGRIAFTPANKTAFQLYEKQHRDFLEEFKRLPSDLTGIERVQSLAAALTETTKSFDYNVPVEVKSFLEAVQSGGAPLDLLTDTVKTWLAENDAFASYRILPRGADGGR
ncbi:hypothetical protein ACERZ8_03675 [Tateyamaria armeniaca]|uniref:Uncharacterized protein n=1 Tax=Tateyamaria armeniaca TaxID=2518930 RepID=A0ABW8UPG6_9RHOB